MADMTDVKRIYLDWRGISHIVASERTGWVHTLCGTMATGESIDWPMKPRVCRKCRERLKAATVVKSKEPEPVKP